MSRIEKTCEIASGRLLERWRAFLAELDDRQKIRWDEFFVNGSLAPHQKRGPAVGKT